MESSIAEFLMWQLAYEQLPTYHNITSVLCVTVAILAQGTHWAVASLHAFFHFCSANRTHDASSGGYVFSAPASLAQTQTQPCDRAPRAHTYKRARVRTCAPAPSRHRHHRRPPWSPCAAYA